MQRVSVIGCSGSGKTTLARDLANRLGLRYLELDALFHQPGWTPKPDEHLRAEIAEFSRAKHWVIDGNYVSHGVSDIVWPIADTVVWLDPPRHTVMRRVVLRTLRRVITREELWNGNREPWSNLWNPRPEKNIIVWSWTRFEHYRQRYEQALDRGTWDHLDVRRLTSKAEMKQFLDQSG